MILLRGVGSKYIKPGSGDGTTLQALYQSRLINDTDVVRALRTAETAQEAHKTLVQREKQLGLAP